MITSEWHSLEPQPFNIVFNGGGWVIRIDIPNEEIPKLADLLTRLLNEAEIKHTRSDTQA